MVGRLVRDMLDPNERTARDIVAQGGQILLPYDIADAEVTFSRRRLVALIVEALEKLEDSVKDSLADWEGM